VYDQHISMREQGMKRMSFWWSHSESNTFDFDSLFGSRNTHHSPIPVTDPAPDPTPIVSAPPPVVDPVVTTPPPVVDPVTTTTPPPVVDPVVTTPPPVVDPVVTTPTPTPVTSAPPPPTNPVTGATLTHHDGTIHTSFDGQVIKDMDIWVTGNADGIDVTNNNVVIENVHVHHMGGVGVNVSGASGVQLLNSEIDESAPPSGINPGNENAINVNVENSTGFHADHVTARDGASGFYLLDSPNASLTYIDGYNFHGPEPRGQFIQFDKSSGGTVDTFYTQNDMNHSYPEDNVSVYASQNVTIKNGVIDGNNSISGVGVMFENGSTGGLVQHVDTVHMGNGSFSSYANDVTFDDVHAFDNWGGIGPRGANSSGSLIFNHSATGVAMTHATYTNPYDPGNIDWGMPATLDIHEAANATPMAHFANHFDFTV
jgi:hypothetical protein